jgi:hypothetical protein
MRRVPGAVNAASCHGDSLSTTDSAKHAALKGSPWDTTVNFMNYFRGLMDPCLAAVPGSHLFRDEEVAGHGLLRRLTTTGEPNAFPRARLATPVRYIQVVSDSGQLPQGLFSEPRLVGRFLAEGTDRGLNPRSPMAVCGDARPRC